MAISSGNNTERLVRELMTIEGKAEIVGGKIVRLPLHCCVIASAKTAIQASLHSHAAKGNSGRVGVSTLSFVVDLPNRKSFCADVSFYDLPPAGMGFPRGAPLFAIEFRIENNRAAELAIAAKISDYFAAGTLVVWDVDLQSADVIKSYRASDPQNPLIFRRGEVANAEPAAQNWSLNVDELFA